MTDARALRHLVGYLLIIALVFRPVIDLWTGVLGCLIVVVFELPGVGKLMELAKQWVGRNDRCDPL